MSISRILAHTPSIELWVLTVLAADVAYLAALAKRERRGVTLDSSRPSE